MYNKTYLHTRFTLFPTFNDTLSVRGRIFHCYCELSMQTYHNEFLIDQTILPDLPHTLSMHFRSDWYTVLSPARGSFQCQPLLVRNRILSWLLVCTFCLCKSADLVNGSSSGNQCPHLFHPCSQDFKQGSAIALYCRKA